MMSYRSNSDSTEAVGPRTIHTARSILALATGEVLGKVATFALVVVAARVLGPSEYGVFAFALALGTLLAVIPAWGFDPALVQAGSATNAKIPLLLAQSLTARTVIAVPVLGIAVGVELIGGRGVHGIASTMVIFACLLDVYSDAYRAAATAREALGRTAFVLIVQRCVSAILAVALAFSGFGIVGVSSGYLCGSIVGVVGMYIAVRRLGIRSAWRAVSIKGIRAIASMSQVFGITSLVSMALFRVDAVMLGILAGDAAVGAYSAAYRLLETVLFVSWIIARAVFPVVAANPERHRIAHGLERGFTLLLAVFLPYAIVLAVRGGDVVLALYGKRFADRGAVEILTWLSPAPLLFGAAYLASFSLMASGPDRRIIASSFVALVVNVGLNAWLIPRMGGVGAAAATSLSYAAQVAVVGAYAIKTLGWPLRWRALAPSLLASLVLVVVLLAPWPLWPALIAGFSAYGVAWWSVARWLDPAQILVIVGMLRRR